MICLFLTGLKDLLPSGGHRIKTDSKLIRAAIQIAHKSLHKESYDLSEIAEKVLSEDGRTQSKLLLKK